MKHLIAIALGGSFGAAARYMVSKSIQSSYSQMFPAGTLFVNAAGSFMIGFLFYLFDSIIVSRDIRSFLMIGFLGSFTTFSTYSLETVNLFKDGEIKLAIYNLILNNLLCIIMVISGLLASRFLMKILK